MTCIRWLLWYIFTIFEGFLWYGTNGWILRSLIWLIILLRGLISTIIPSEVKLLSFGLTILLWLRCFIQSRWSVIQEKWRQFIFSSLLVLLYILKSARLAVISIFTCRSLHLRLLRRRGCLVRLLNVLLLVCVQNITSFLICRLWMRWAHCNAL